MADDNPFHSMISIIRDENSPLSFGRSGDNPPYVYAFQLKCRNIWDKPLEIKEVTFSSELISFSMSKAIEGKPIPPGADFVLVAALPTSDGAIMENGMFFDEFRTQFGSFAVDIDLADNSYGTWHFPADQVEAMLAAGEKTVARK